MVQVLVAQTGPVGSSLYGPRVLGESADYVGLALLMHAFIQNQQR